MSWPMALAMSNSASYGVIQKKNKVSGQKSKYHKFYFFFKKKIINAPVQSQSRHCVFPRAQRTLNYVYFKSITFVFFFFQ